MTLNEIHRKAEAFRSKARLTVLSVMVIWLFLVVAFSFAYLKAPNWIPRAAWALLAFGVTFVAVQAWRWQWPRNLSFDSAETGLRAYRRELEKQRDYSSHIWRRSGLPFVFAGLAVLVVPPIAADPRVASKAAPLFVLLIVWFAIFIPLRRRRERELQREIDELTALERENQ